MKPVDIIRDANANLLRSKSRTLLTIIAIFIGAMTLTITNGIGAGVSNYIDKQLGNLGAKDVLIIQPRLDDNPFAGGPKKYDAEKVSGSAYAGMGPKIPLLQDSDLERIKNTEGIAEVTPFLSASPEYIVGVNDEKYQIQVSEFIGGMNLSLEAGSSPDNSSTKYEITLQPDYPEVLGFDSPEASVGKTVTIGIKDATGMEHQVKAKVAGVQQQTLVNGGGANINSALTKKLHAIQSEGAPTGLKDSYAAVVARTTEGIDQEGLSAVKDRLRDEGYIGQTIEDQIGQFKQAINAIVTVLNVFAIITLLAAGFGIVNTLLMAVQERTKEIGLMKAMGLSSGKIFALFSFEAILLGFWGSLLGSLAGIGVGLVVNEVASNSFLKDLPGFDLTAFSPVSVIAIMAIIMIIAFIAGTVPARRASRKNPIEALRYE